MSDHQDWTDEEFCNVYESTWEISTDDVHYGWLANGERELKLLSGEKFSGANVLDIGCGMAQNLIALAKGGANGYGLDISKCMIRRAESLVSEHGLEHSINLRVGDMRDARNFEYSHGFDLVLSVYSMEYLSSVRELRHLLYVVHKKLVPGGAFVFCFSHPSQASRYPELMNRSIPIGVGKYRTFNYSFKDVTEGLYKAGFTIERIIEQGTKSPSKLDYKDSLSYPYHFREGKNPCRGDFDELSNGAPHTVIYKARRYHDPFHGLPRRSALGTRYREVWGYKRSVKKVSKVRLAGLYFDALHFAPMDNVKGLMDVLSFSVTTFDVSSDVGDIAVNIQDMEERSIDGNSVLGLVQRKLLGLGLEPIYRESIVSAEEDEFERRVYLSDIFVLGDLVRDVYSTARVGLLIFVNGHEPIKGELPVDQVLASPGDNISLTYVALDENNSGENLNSWQLELGLN